MNPKALFILISYGITSGVFGANLRRRKTYSSDEKKSNLPAVQDNAATPSIFMDKSMFDEGETITVHFEVGSPTDEFYSMAPSHLDFDFKYWSIGLFMRDADPQEGSHPPIVSIGFCGVSDCDVNSGSVTFGSESDLMLGHWPLEVALFGTGYDAWVLDGNGAAAIGPFEFYVRDEYVDMNLEQSLHETTSVEKKEPKKPMPHDSHPLARYKKGVKASTAHDYSASASNAKIVKASGLQSSQSILSSKAIPTVQNEDDATAGTISPDKEEYEDDEEVTFTISVHSNSKSSNYSVGIFMRNANPQGGALDPIVSLPLCPESGCIISEGSINTSITFGMDTLGMDTPMGMNGSQWPMDLYEFGTGFDAYILDERGNDVTGPAKFNIIMP